MAAWFPNAQAGLIDEFQFVVNPVILGEGRTMFGGLKHPVDVKLAQSRVFPSGNAFLRYEPAA